MHIATINTPKTCAIWKLFGLEFGEIARILHHLDSPALATDFKRGLENDIPHTGSKIDEDLFGSQLRLLEDLTAQAFPEFAVDIVAAILVGAQSLNFW